MDWDHPRRCGENRFAYERKAKISGSPPQVRGKLYQPQLLKDCARITPAGAGKTFAHFVDFFLCQDHPRRCGENNIP